MTRINDRTSVPFWQPDSEAHSCGKSQHEPGSGHAKTELKAIEIGELESGVQA